MQAPKDFTAQPMVKLKTTSIVQQNYVAMTVLRFHRECVKMAKVVVYLESQAIGHKITSIVETSNSYCCNMGKTVVATGISCIQVQKTVACLYAHFPLTTDLIKESPYVQPQPSK